MSRPCVPLLQRFWSHVGEPDERGCWPWLGYRTNGYGAIMPGGTGGSAIKAHRLSYELLVGPIPEGLTLDHLCRNRACVNPAHLEPVTHRLNILRGEGPAAQNALKTHCIHGHPFDQTNTYTSGGRRACRVCRRVKSLRWKQRQRQKKKEALAA